MGQEAIWSQTGCVSVQWVLEVHVFLVAGGVSHAGPSMSQHKLCPNGRFPRLTGDNLLTVIQPRG